MEHSVKHVWIDPSWLSWDRFWDSMSPVPNDGAIRLYEIHQHACDRLASDPNEFDSVDAIMTLRRVVARRVKALEETYQLRELPIGAKPKHDLELLESFGIIRPFMLKRLIEIRNFVEHRDSSPPSTEECLMFADLVWYFLRSTDGLTRARADRIFFELPGVDFSSDDNHPQIALDFTGPFSEAPGIGVWHYPSSFSDEPRASWVEIAATKVTYHEYAETTWVSIDGKICGTDEQMKLIYEIYFQCSHFG